MGVGQYCQVVLKFTPSATGVRTATLTISDDATGSPQIIALTGEGQTTVSSLQISPQNPLFTSSIGVGSGTNYVYLTNTGNSSITRSNYRFSGANAADFSIAYNYCASQSGNYLSHGANESCICHYLHVLARRHRDGNPQRHQQRLRNPANRHLDRNRPKRSEVLRTLP